LAQTQSVIPAAAGIGLRTQHLASLASEDAAGSASWLEIHSETFLCDGGPRLAMLDAVAARYPISCHGVGLSLGSAEGLDKTHLARLKRLFNRAGPGLVSEHLAWSVTDGVYLNDLLPLPTTEATLAVVSRNVAEAQDTFGRQILVENPSTYVSFAGAAMSEPEFLARLVERTGCGLLLDINNMYVSAANHGFDAETYLRAVPAAAVGEIHLAGHTASGGLLIDTHNGRVADAVWDLYAATIARIGPRPTLVEWDASVPDLAVLLREAAQAQTILNRARKCVPHVA
jgi:uncharacterized protein (UPF0276 family)